MKVKKLYQFSIVVSIFLIFTGCLDENRFIKEVDSKYYYAKEEGLRDLTATIKCSLIENLIESEPRLKDTDIKVKFYWKLPHKEKVEITGFPQGMEPIEDKIKKVFEGRGDIIVPKPISETMKRYKTRIIKNGEFTKLIGTAKTPSEEASEYIVWIDEDLIISKMEVKGKETNLSLNFKWLQKDKKWLIKELESSFEKMGRAVNAVATMEYQKVNDFWLVSELTMIYKDMAGNVISQPVVFEYLDYKLNTGLAELIFEK